MLVTFQFPIADARPFHEDADLRLSVPDWPNPTTEITPQFVHHFGRAVERRRVPDEALPDELKFCNAHRAIRFHELASRGYDNTHYYFPKECAFRRLFCDGRAVVRVELGLCNRSGRRWSQPSDASSLLTILQDLCDMPTKVPMIDRPSMQKKVAALIARGMVGTPTKTTAEWAVNMESEKLIKQGRALSSLYAHATLGTASMAKAEKAAELVEAGNPIVICELDNGFFPPDLSSFVRIAPELVRGTNVAFGRLHTRSGQVKVWVIESGKAKKEDVRSLRLSFLRLHAEQEVLDIILKQIQRRRLLNPSTTETANAVDNYFNERTQLINRAYFKGIKQSAIREAIDASELVTPLAVRESLITRYDGARKNVRAKILQYQQDRAAIRLVKIVQVQPGGTLVEKQTTITQTGDGIINVAEYMNGVTNTVNKNMSGLPANDKAKKLVEELTAKISEIAPRADAAEVKKLGKHLSRLSEDMAEPEAEREAKWYEVSLKGLKDAATAIGAVAAPIVAIVAKLTPLFGG